MLGKHHADAFDSRENAVPYPAFTNIRDQRSHCLTPGVIVGDLQDCFVGDDLRPPLGE